MLEPMPRTTSVISTTSVVATAPLNTVTIPEMTRMSLEDFCALISFHRALRKAEITSAECYFEWSSGILHRFLILELRCEEKGRVFLRLDRRAGRRIFYLATHRGSTPAQDSVSVPRQCLLCSLSDELGSRRSLRRISRVLLAEGNMRTVKYSGYCSRSWIYKAFSV